MPKFRSIYMVPRNDGDGMKAVSKAVADSKRYVFEGVDGDEDANTVTYYFRLRTDDDDN